MRSVTAVRFEGYRALRDYSVQLQHVNVLVGPNNCGKSTVLGAFRILAQALKRAGSRAPERIVGPHGRRLGWRLPQESLPIASENIHSNYADIDSTIEFSLTGRGKLLLHFPSDGGCAFFAEDDGSMIVTSAELKRAFQLDVQCVPVLGPLEHEEQLVQQETVRKNLLTTRASRNFRNYWLQFPEDFPAFRDLVRRTWPGMDVQPPERNGSSAVMFCLEQRISRELYWAGFGFQIWLQLLTHICRAKESSIIVIDEPEIYLHPDVQRQLLGILRACEADIVLATHSTEMMGEADPTEIVLVDKTTRHARRLKDADGVQAALEAVGSIQNITLTRLARNRRLLFVEGMDDFQVLRKFASKLGCRRVSAAVDLTAIESGGFSSWQEVRALASGFERALSIRLNVAAIYDRDYWCEEEIGEISADLNHHLTLAHIHSRKEIENYLLVPTVLQRALEKAVTDRTKRSGGTVPTIESIISVLERITSPMKAELQGQYIAKRVAFIRRTRRDDDATITAESIAWFEAKWSDLSARMQVVPGKLVLARLRDEVSGSYKVTLTDHRIVNEFTISEIPDDLAALLVKLESYSSATPPT